MEAAATPRYEPIFSSLHCSVSRIVAVKTSLYVEAIFSASSASTSVA